MVDRRSMILALALAGAACGRTPADDSTQPAPATQNETQAPALPPETVKPGEAGGLPDDRTPIAEGPIDPKSGQGAGQVLQRFGALLEQRKFGEAYRLWSDGGRASGLSEAQFAAAYGKYDEIHAEVGAPGQSEGAAGSIYVDVPFRLYGTIKRGGPFNLIGTVTLRRVNEVPGSTEEQRGWHIYQSDLDARP
jgi:hypothetical protein